MVCVTATGADSYRRPQVDGPRGVFSRAQRGFTLFEMMLVAAIIGVLAGIAYPSYQRYLDQTRNAQAKVDIVGIEGALERYYNQNLAYPDTLAQAGVGGLLDPWGKPYRYLNIVKTTNKSLVRKDRNLVPINSDYDLYSTGKDGQTQSPLTVPVSRDDIIRANNGQFVGLAADY